MINAIITCNTLPQFIIFIPPLAAAAVAEFSDDACAEVVFPTGKTIK